MSTPNPLLPQGTLADNTARSRTRVVFFAIVAAHVLFIGALLLHTGCRRTPEDHATGEQPTASAIPERFAPTSPPPLPPPPPGPELAATQQVAQTSPSPAEVTPTAAPPPPPPPPPPAQPAPAFKEHKIAKGETFAALGAKYGVGWKAIAEANPGVDPTRLKPGMVIKIPEPKPKEPTANVAAQPSAGEPYTTYKVQSGDTLTKIARRFGTTPKALRSLNQLKTDRIKVGETLKVPAKPTTPAAPTETKAPGG